MVTRSPLFVLFALIVSFTQAQPLTEVQKLLASDAQPNDQSGYSVAISGDYAIVGAWQEDAVSSNSGSAYIYERDAGGIWQEVQKLVASDAQASDYFGYGVALGGDRAVIGAFGEDAGGPNAGAAYIFERDASGVWQEVQKLVASDAQANDYFAESVSISGDRIIVGAEGESTAGSWAGAAYVFERDGGGVWQEIQKLVAGDAQANDYFGYSTSISGDRAIIGSLGEDAGGSDAGAAYVFERDGSGVWQEFQKLVASDAQASDYFGYSVSISGDRAISGAYGESSAGGLAGAAYVFERDGSGVWQEVQKLVASDGQSGDQFGYSNVISDDRAVIGAWRVDLFGTTSAAGAAYVFERDDSGVWQEVQKVVPGDLQMGDLFGISVSISGDRVFIGAPGEDDGGSQAGAVYVFEVLSTAVTWTGTNGRDWNDAGNWSTGSVPAAADEIIIPTTPSGGNFPSVDFDLTVEDLTVESGATLDIEPGFALIIGAGGTIDAQGTITLNSDATGTALLDDFTNGGTYTGDLTVETFVAGSLSGENQHYISSPVDAPNVLEIGDDLDGPFGPGLPGVDGVAVTPYPSCDTFALEVTSNYGNLFELDESNISTCFLERWVVRSAGQLANGAGYSAYLPAGSTADWTGAPNAGVVNAVTITNQGGSSAYPEHHGWNLLGNPYPSPLSIDDFLLQNGTVLNSPNQYEPSGPFSGTYQPYAPGSNVAIAQGFMVFCSITSVPGFSDAMRTTGPAMWKNEAGDYFDHKLEIEVHGNGHADRTEVYFNREATADFDVVYDRTKVASDAGQPTIWTGDMLAMNGQHLQDMRGRIPVTIDPGAEGSFELRFSGIETFDGSTGIYLEDAWTGERVDLRTTDSHMVDLDEGPTNERFHVVFEKSTTGVDDLSAHGIDVYSHRDVVTIDLVNTEAERSDVVITDMTGRTVATASDLGRERTKFTIPMAAGIYMVTVVQDGRRFTKQVVIVR